MASSRMPPPNLSPPDRRRTVFGTIKSISFFDIGLKVFNHHEFIDCTQINRDNNEEERNNINFRKKQIRHRLVRKDMGFMRRTNSFYADDDNFYLPKTSDIFMSSRRRLDPGLHHIIYPPPPSLPF